jgi:hypothetical protein
LVSGLAIMSAVPWVIKTGAPGRRLTQRVAQHDSPARLDLSGIGLEELNSVATV